MKYLKNLGKALNKAEQKLINGGGILTCIPTFCNPWSDLGTLKGSDGNYYGCCPRILEEEDLVGIGGITP